MIASNIICRGASRFLNTAYFQDVQISGTATLSSLSLSGNLSVTGTSTLSGNTTVGGTLGVTGAATFNNWITTANNYGWKSAQGGGWYMNDPSYIRSYGKPVMMGHNLYFNSQSYYVNTNGAASFSSIAAPTATISNATISGDLVVNGVIHGNEFIKNIVKAVGGQLYVSPTFQATSSTTISCISADASYVYLTLQDNGITSSEYAGATWYSGSKIMLSGTLTANTTGHTEEIIFSSAPGELTAQMNSGTNGAKKLQIKVEYNNANTYFKSGSLIFSDVAVMMYQINNSGNLYPIGIYIKAYGTDNQKSYIDIFGGSSTSPNARLGLLTGLGNMPSGSTIQGWGIYTDNGFYKGIVEANGGLIGNWNIGTTGMYYNSDAPGSTSITMIPGGTTASSASIGGSSGSKQWVFTVKNLFGVDTSGALYSSSGKIGGWSIGTSSLYNTTNSMTSTGVGLYLGTDGIRNYSSGTQYVNITSGKITALGVDVSGKITATSGAIGGFDITSTAIKTKDVDVTSNADNSISLSSADFTRTINSTPREGLRFAIGHKFGVTGNGTIYAGSANISGTLTAGNGSKIGDLTIADGKLSVPAANITGKLSADHINTSSITIGQSQVDGLSTALGNKANSSTVTALSNKVTAVYGTCDTAANTQVKNVMCSNFEYYDGALITVAFSTANTYNVSTIRLNVNSKGQKNIKVANVITAADNCLLWGAGAVITFRYDGDYFVVVGEPRTWYGASTTAANTYVKTDTTAVAGCVVCKGTVVSLSMQHDNTATTPFLNIAGTGNIELYAGDGTTTRPTTSNGLGWTAGSTAQFIFDGQYWRVGDTAGLARAYSAQSTANTANTNATNAAKTATNFITADGTNGIKVHNTSNTTDYVQIISDGTHIYKGGNDVALFGDTVRLGRIANGVIRTQIDSDSFDVIKRSSDTDTTLATFGETAVIGNMSARGVSIDTNGFKFNNNGEQNFFIGIDNRYAETITSGNATVTNSSTNKSIDGLTYYRVASIPSGDTVVSVEGDAVYDLNEEEQLSAAVMSPVAHWVVEDGYLWVEDGYSSYSQFEQFITYSYTTQAQSNLPYMVLGTSAYEDDIIAGVNSFAQGYKNKALGSFSTALGSSTIASSETSFACGMNTRASGQSSFTCGITTKASGQSSFACGRTTLASGNYSHAEGDNTNASGSASHAEGQYTNASGVTSHAEGGWTIAKAQGAHAEGVGSTATKVASHAEGEHTVASGKSSHAGGYYTVAQSNYNTVIGKYNKATVSTSGSGSNISYTYTDVGDYPFIIGNGTSNTTAGRSNAFTVDWSGNVVASGSLSAKGATLTGALTGTSATFSGNVLVAGSVRTENDNIDNALVTVNSPFQLLYCNARKMGGFIFFSLELWINASFVSNYPYVFATIASDYVPKNDIEIGIGFNTDGSYNPKGVATWRAYNNGNIDFILQSTGGPYVFLSGFYAYE